MIRQRYYLAYTPKEPLKCEVIGIDSDVSLEIFSKDYGHYYKGLVGPFKTSGAAKLLALTRFRSVTVGEIEREYSQLSKISRERIAEDYQEKFRFKVRRYTANKLKKFHTGYVRTK